MLHVALACVGDICKYAGTSILQFRVAETKCKSV